MNNIYLVGMMGAGKSAVGQHLAHLLGRSFIETDQLIIETAGMSIAEIFGQLGERSFRKMECDILRDVSSRSEVVVSCGGGIVTNEKNIELMKKTGRLIYLRAKPETLWARVRHDRHRPLLNVKDPLQKIKDLLNERASFYNQSDFTVETDSESPESVAKKIKLLLEAHSSKS